MTFCIKCGEKVEYGSGFCQICGTVVENKIDFESMPKKGLVRKIEQTFFFKIARIFAWFIAAFATIGFIVSVIYVIKTAPQAFIGRAKVSQEEVRRYIERDRFRNEYETEIISPEHRARLDKEIYELIELLPSDMRTSDREIESLRSHIRNMLARWRSINDKLTAIREANSMLNNFSMEQRAAAMGSFFTIKAEKEAIMEVRKAEARTNLKIWAGTMLAMIYTITMITMILVALAIERNTRKKVE